MYIQNQRKKRGGGRWTKKEELDTGRVRKGKEMQKKRKKKKEMIIVDYNHRYYGQTCCILYTQLHSYILFYRLRAGRVLGLSQQKQLK